MNISKQSLKNIVIVLLILGAGTVVFLIDKNNTVKQRAGDLALRDINKLGEQERIKALEDQVKALTEETSKLKDDAEGSIKYAAYIKLAEAQLELGKNQEALDSLNRIPEDKRTNSRVVVAYIRAYKGVGDLRKAKELSSQNVLVYNEDPAIWVAYLESFTDMPNDQLNGLYREAIVKTQSNLQVMISYAKFCERIGDKATAIAAWETAINGDPANEAKYREEIARLR